MKETETRNLGIASILKLVLLLGFLLFMGPYVSSFFRTPSEINPLDHPPAYAIEHSDELPEDYGGRYLVEVDLKIYTIPDDKDLDDLIEHYEAILRADHWKPTKVEFESSSYGPITITAEPIQGLDWHNQKRGWARSDSFNFHLIDIEGLEEGRHAYKAALIKGED